MSDNGFDRAQAQYDAMLPEEAPDPITCDECNGSGTIGDDECGHEICPKCKGEGEVIPEPDEDNNEPEYESDDNTL